MTSYQGIVLPQYNKNIIRALLGLKLEKRPLVEPSADEVLIKIHAAPVNPSDIAFMQGGYNIVKTLPVVMGFEGAGTVVAAGENAKTLIGKKVSCFVQEDADGTWAEYLLTSKRNVMVLNDDMDMDQAACFTVNPFTAYGLMEIARTNESEAVLLNAAGGQVARFIRAMAQAAGVETVNIVRKEETAALLKNEGVKHVLAETHENFEKQLQTLCRKLHVTTAFDAVGGALTGKMFHAMPDDAELILYGGLSNKPASGLDTLPLIFNRKAIYGFSLPDWKEETHNFEEISVQLQQMFMSGKLETKIQGKIALKDAVKGLRQYIGAMSRGKVLLHP